MFKKTISIILLLILITSAYVQAEIKIENTDNLPGPKKGEIAPDFELENLKGDIIKLSDFKGKKVILNFWATWCPPCKDEMPDMEEFYQQAGKDVVILAVNIDPQYNVKKFVKENKITFPILLDRKDQVNTKYQIISIPTTYFIDEKGIIRHKHISVLTKEMIIEYIKNT